MLTLFLQRLHQVPLPIQKEDTPGEIYLKKAIIKERALKKQKNKKLENLEIIENVFQDLRGADSGGAVYVLNQQTILTITRSLFVGCSALKNGGALYGYTRKFTTFQSMYVECFITDNLWSGQAFMVTSNVTNVTETTAISCPPSLGHRGSEVLILVGGAQHVTQLNSSHNIAFAYASGLATSESISFEMKRCMFYYNKSPNHILALIHMRPDDDISFCNIIHNTVDTDGLIFVSGGYCVFQKCVFKKNSGVISVFNSAYGPGFLALEECAIDIPQQKAMENQFNLYNIGSVFTKKPTKIQIPKNTELFIGFLEKSNRVVVSA